MRSSPLRWLVPSALGLLIAVACSRLPFGQPDAPVGTDLGGTPAPDFTLSNQDGAAVSLHDLQGHAVALVFLYTDCPDLCPLTAEKMRAAYLQLPSSDQARVALVAVSVDPSRDTQEQRTAFVHAHRLDGVLQYLNGDLADVYAVWRSYAIGVERVPDDPAATNYQVDHNAVTYVIDAHGHEQELLDDEDYTPEQLAGDLRLALRQG